MFDSVGWGEILILIVAALVILGPERLPGAISASMQWIRRAREYATGATDQLKNELGPEFDDLRKPLADLNELRGMTPKAVVTKHLLDGDESVFTTFTDAGKTLRSATEPITKPVSRPLPAVTDDPQAPTAPVPPEQAPPGSEAPAPTPATARRAVADWDAT
ncbi:MAG: Sec-independent protein translocase protein TatB [Gordonia sp. (in: high G+C Gram-positive bacteria)]